MLLRSLFYAISFSECDNAFCPNSHLPLCYDRAELAPQAGYIVYADFIHALSVVFGPKFIWKYELYIEKLYEAYGTDQQVVSRHVSYSLRWIYKLKLKDGF